MIHEIAPELFDNQYKNQEPQMEDPICLFASGKMFLYKKDGKISWPTYAEVKEEVCDVTYYFSISGRAYFGATAKEGFDHPEGMWVHWQQVRDQLPVKEAFAGMTAMHLQQWYSSVQFCGRCGTKAVHDEKERMMRCPKCGNLMFPKISPAIIVAVVDKQRDRLLVTRYAGNVNGYALVAGFVEIGETVEECVSREVMEETGIKIKNIQYYGSQPWGFAGNLMMGYLAELDGDDTIHLDEEELATACWLSAEELPEVPERSSLTRDLIRRFKEKIEPFGDGRN